MTAYYNDHDPDVCAWLRELIRAGVIPDGEVDCRSILDVEPVDLAGFRQCHFFAGIGGWAYALRLAGWPDDAPVWTGSPPCQPFSVAGKGLARDDSRHLAPAFLRLVRAARPPVLFGEQVASAAVFGRAATTAERAAGGEPEWAWLDDLFADLEAAGYAAGAGDIPAAGVGAPHIRQRCFFGAVRLADTDDARSQGRPGMPGGVDQCVAGASVMAGGLADADGWDTSAERQQPGWKHGQQSPDSGAMRGKCGGSQFDLAAGMERPRAAHSPWRDADWLFCRDGKWRPVEPASQRMAYGVSSAVERLRSCDGEKKEILNAADCFGFRDEILFALRSGVRAETLWLALGGCVGFSSASILLAVVCEQAGELGHIFNGEATSGVSDAQECMRTLRHAASATSCASQGRQHTEQRAVQFGNALSKLSQESASLSGLITSLSDFNGAPLSEGAPARVGRLRGYGNAIVPQAAAKFVMAFMESLR